MADFRTEVKPIAVLGFNENASRNLSVQIAKRETRIVVRPLVAGALIAFLLSWAGTANAQQWLQNRRFEEGPGIRLGSSLVLHPGLGVEGGYDTNVFYSQYEERGAGRLRISAHLDLATRPPQRTEDEEGNSEHGSVDFRFGASVAYHEYLSSDSEMNSDLRNVDVGGNLDLHFLPGRPFSVMFNDNFIRRAEPEYEGHEDYDYDNDRNNARLTLQYSPGGGMFEFQFGYDFGLRHFEQAGVTAEEPNVVYLGNFLAHAGFVNIRWRFLPKSAFIFTGSYTFIDHLGTSESSENQFRQVHDSHNLRGSIGVVSLLTRKFSILAQIGYAAGFYTGGSPTDYDMVIGRLDLRFHITPTAKISLGYARDYYDAIFSDFYSRDRINFVYDHLIAGRVLLSLSAGFSYMSFSSPIYPSGEDPGIERNDPMIDGTLFVEYRIRDWIAINTTIRYIDNLTSSDRAPYEYDPDQFVEWGPFRQFLLMAGIRAMY